MEGGGESVKYGTEKELLNNVFGARLRITALRGSSGPGIELLEYLAPRDGRPFPADEHANDVVHRQTILLARERRRPPAICRQSELCFFWRGRESKDTAEVQ